MALSQKLNGFLSLSVQIQDDKIIDKSNSIKEEDLYLDLKNHKDVENFTEDQI